MARLARPDNRIAAFTAFALLTACSPTSLEAPRMPAREKRPADLTIVRAVSEPDGLYLWLVNRGDVPATGNISTECTIPGPDPLLLVGSAGDYGAVLPGTKGPSGETNIFKLRVAPWPSSYLAKHHSEQLVGECQLTLDQFEASTENNSIRVDVTLP